MPLIYNKFLLVIVFQIYTQKNPTNNYINQPRV